MSLEKTAGAEEVHAAVRKLMAAMRTPNYSVSELPPMHPDDYHRYADHEGHYSWSSFAPKAGDEPCDECGWEVGHAWTCSKGRNDPQVLNCGFATRPVEVVLSPSSGPRSPG